MIDASACRFLTPLFHPLPPIETRGSGIGLGPGLTTCPAVIEPIVPTERPDWLINTLPKENVAMNTTLSLHQKSWTAICALTLCVGAPANAAFATTHGGAHATILETSTAMVKGKKRLITKAAVTTKKQAGQAAMAPSFTFTTQPLPNAAYPRINTASVSPDGTLVAAGSDDGMLRLWSTTNGQVAQTLFDPQMSAIGGTKFHSPVRAAAFSPDGKTIASGSYAGVIIFDTQTGTTVRRYLATSMTSAIVFSPDGASVAVASAGIQLDPKMMGTVQIINPNTGNVVITIPNIVGGATALAFSPDGKSLAMAGTTGDVIVWDTTTGQEKGHFDSASVSGNNDYARAVAFSPDGMTLVTGGGTNTPWQGMLKIWSFQNGTVLKIISGGEPIQSLAYSHNGTHLITGSFNGTVNDYDPSHWTLRATSPNFLGNRNTASSKDGHAGAVTALAFTLDDATLFSGSSDFRIKGWRF
jgi:WD40 repeat protein